MAFCVEKRAPPSAAATERLTRDEGNYVFKSGDDLWFVCPRAEDTDLCVRGKVARSFRKFSRSVIGFSTIWPSAELGDALWSYNARSDVALAVPYVDHCSAVYVLLESQADPELVRAAEAHLPANGPCVADWVPRGHDDASLFELWNAAHSVARVRYAYPLWDHPGGLAFRVVIP